MTYHEVKANHAAEIDALITEFKGFFAFSDKQVKEGMEKNGLTDEKCLTSLSMGLILPTANAKNFLTEWASMTEKHNNEIKNNQEIKESAILYELNNHESYYTGDIEDCVNLFSGIYTREEIKAVYLKNKPENDAIN